MPSHLIKTSRHGFKLDDPNIIATSEFEVQDDKTASLALTQNGATSRWTRRKEDQADDR